MALEILRITEYESSPVADGMVLLKEPVECYPRLLARVGTFKMVKSGRECVKSLINDGCGWT